MTVSPANPGGSGGNDLWVATRPATEQPFVDAVNLGSSVNSSASEEGPSISRDGLALFFLSGRSGGVGGGDIYVVTRANTDAPFDNLANLGSPVNSTSLEAFPEISGSWPSEGAVLYFLSQHSGGSRDLFAASWVDLRPCVVSGGASDPDCNENDYLDACEIEKGFVSDVNRNGTPDGCEPGFRRGECNDDGRVDIADASCILARRFRDAPAPGCLAAANTNGESEVDIADAIYLLGALFLGGPPPPPPFPGCGPGTERDRALGCLTPSC